MFCTIKFVYYKSFCVRDDIGSYIRTVYHMVSHTPKRKVGVSNPFWDTRERRCKSFFGIAAFLFALPICGEGQYLSEHTKNRFLRHSTSKTTEKIGCSQKRKRFSLFQWEFSDLLLSEIAWDGGLCVAGFWPGALVQSETAYCGGHSTECKMRNLWQKWTFRTVSLAKQVWILYYYYQKYSL